MRKIKRCSCCLRQHDERSWRALPLVGYQPLGFGEPGVAAIELRNCGCMSTIGVGITLADLLHVIRSKDGKARETAIQSLEVYIEDDPMFAEEVLASPSSR